VIVNSLNEPYADRMSEGASKAVIGSTCLAIPAYAVFIALCQIAFPRQFH